MSWLSSGGGGGISLRGPAIPVAKQQVGPSPLETDSGSVTDRLIVMSRATIDATLPGDPDILEVTVAWHPKYPVIAVATSTAIVEYDAISGCRRSMVDINGSPLKLTYSSDGHLLLLFTKERTLTAWSTTTWKRTVLIPPHPKRKYDKKKLVSGLLAITPGRGHIVYYAAVGKTTLRAVPLSLPPVSKGTKPDKDHIPGAKLKFENKRPLVALASHLYDQHLLFLVSADNQLLVCQVQGEIMTTVASVPVNIDTKKERISICTMAHPQGKGGVLVAVEGSYSGVTVIEMLPKRTPYVIGTLGFGAGAVSCGVGLVEGGNVLLASARQANGNIQLRSWKLVGGEGELSVLPMTPSPGSVWDAFGGSPALLSEGIAVAGWLAIHGPTGLVAVCSGVRGNEFGAAAHARLPLLQVLDSSDVTKALGAPRALPVHSGLEFWTYSGDIEPFRNTVVSKLRFPQYGHVFSADGHVSSFDLSHCICTEALVLPCLNSMQQERVLSRVVRSSSRAVWAAFMCITSKGTASEGEAPRSSNLIPGQFEFTIVPDHEATIAGQQVFLPGRDGAFIGQNDELFAVLSNSGRIIAVFETGKFKLGVKPLFCAECKEGNMISIFKGPPALIPQPPEPKPEPPSEVSITSKNGDDDKDEMEREEQPTGSPPSDGRKQYPEVEGGEAQQEYLEALKHWSAAEARRLAPPKMATILTASNKVCLLDVSSSGGYSQAGRLGVLQPKYSLQLSPSEALVQLAWQKLLPVDEEFNVKSPGATSVCASAAAILTTQRVLIVDEKLKIVASAPLPGDTGPPVSCLWVGPALLLSTSGGQILQANWDGRVTHACSLISSERPVVLAAALADRLILVSTLPGSHGKADVAKRAFSPLIPMLEAWTTLALMHILPGDQGRIRRHLRTLISSYDASKIKLDLLSRMAAAGFPDISAAVAKNSETVSPVHVAVLQAATGQWDQLIEMVMNDWEKSEYHPRPPPKGSKLQKRMVSLARTCEQYGKFKAAREVFQAAGAWSELMALCIFQADFIGVASIARLSGERDVAALAEQLVAVNEVAHRRVNTALFNRGKTPPGGGRVNTEDWSLGNGSTVTAAGALMDHEPPGGDFDAAADDGRNLDFGSSSVDEDLDVAPAGRIPFMEVSLAVGAADGTAPAATLGGGEEEEEEEEDGQPIPPLDHSTLEAYLGIAGATVNRASVITPTAAAAAARNQATTPHDVRAAAAAPADLEPHMLVMGDDSISQSSGTGVVVQGSGGGETDAQMAARAAFTQQSGGSFNQEEEEEEEDDFFSSDEESSAQDTQSMGGRSGATPSLRFKVAIKSAEEAAAGSGVTNVAQLKSAAASLKLGGLGSSKSGGGLLGSARSDTFGLSRLGGGATSPTPSSARSEAAEDPFAALTLMTRTSSVSSSAAAAQPPSVAGDAFADIRRPPPTAVGYPPQASPFESPLKAPPLKTSKAPMKPQPAPATDLLSGWDEFEAMFSGNVAPTQQAPSPFDTIPPPPQAEEAEYQSEGKVVEWVGQIKAGEWSAAVSSLGEALNEGARDPSYFELYAASKLLMKAESTTDPARFSRFAASLPLEENVDVQHAVLARAVDLNMAQKNYGYAATLIPRLAARYSDKQVQHLLDKCKKGGNKDKNIAKDEDLETFAAIAASCGTKDEVDDLIENLSA